MSKSKEFFDFIDNLLTTTQTKVPEELQEFYEILKSAEYNEKAVSALSETNIAVLTFMRDNSDIKSFTSKRLGEGLDISSRKVAGSMRKLVNEGYVEKFGSNPVNYIITEKGKNYKESI